MFRSPLRLMWDLILSTCFHGNAIRTHYSRYSNRREISRRSPEHLRSFHLHVLQNGYIYTFKSSFLKRLFRNFIDEIDINTKSRESNATFN